MALGSLLSVAHNAQAAWTPTSDQAKGAAVAIALAGATKFLADRQADKSPNKALHTKALDYATSFVNAVKNNPHTILAAYIGYTLVAPYIKLPARAATTQTPPPGN